ncbi:ABC transporter ATP-binding protein/permease [Psychrobium sp. MM17-31]|uniref:ABC transporter ATP-binding protein n=1 Tax=Psychrobium sp. MM17-31 TaxID=2917758 RepID=UPI001EF41272|nr:ABC transporter ATP-binding protein [Psychrobium sp. MM17-31]MCG7532097.1 ABC transporter ATP-binding protein/permease [Psychrobium sp. MM17-31]
MSETAATHQSLWKLLAPMRPTNRSFAGLTLLVLITTALELVLPLYSSHLVDSIGVQGVSTSLIVGLIVIVLAGAVCEAILSWYGGRLGHRISYKLRFSLIGRLLNSQTSQMDNEHSAELSARVVNDSFEVKSVLAEDLIGLLSGTISLFAVISIMFVLDWRLTLVLVGCVVTGFILITPIALMMNNVGKSMQAAEANLLKYLTEWLRYARLIKAHNANEQLHQKSKGLLDECYKHEMKATFIESLIGPIANLVLMISMIAILGFSAHWMAQGTMTLGTVTAFLLYLFGLAFPLMSMAMFFTNLNRAIGTSSRLSEIDSLKQEAVSGEQALTKVESVAFNELSFSRGEQQILNKVSHQFNGAGLSVVIGESGSGKSTLLNQLLGFYPETHSQIAINQQPLASYNLKQLRQAIAWVDQEPKLLHATIRENLTLGLDEDLSQESLFNTLRQVGLDDWLTRINHDLDAVVSEQANQFSGGEKQRFAIARAMLRQAKIILLDEPTSALDKQKKSALMSLIRELATDRRIIMICHDLELIDNDDEVIEIADGKIASSKEPIEN